MFLILSIIVASYIVGGIFWYAIDGWIEWSNGSSKDLFWVSILWPVFCWFIIAGALRDKLKALKQAKLDRQQEEKKLRVAAEKEMAKFEAEIESYIVGKKKAG